jgi:hypothetical protein
MPLNKALFNEPMELKYGMIALSERSGTRFSFDKTAITRFSVG